MEAELEALLKAFDAASDAPPEEADRLLAKPYSQLEQRPHSVVALIASHRLVISKRHDVFQSPWPRRYSSPGKQPMPRESREPWMAQLPAASVPRGRSLMQFDLLMRVAKGHYCKWGESMNHGGFCWTFVDFQVKEKLSGTTNRGIGETERADEIECRTRKR